MPSAELSDDSARDWVVVAVLGRAWGRRGELIATSLTSGPERFNGLEQVYLFGPAGAPGASRPFTLESVWEHRAQLVFKFQGIDSISEAEPLAGAEVRIPREQRAPLAGDEYYQSDLIGCEVVERATGESLGRVVEFQEWGGPQILQVGVEGGEPMLIPFVRAFCVEIDVAGRRIVVDLPEGLKELNVR